MEDFAENPTDKLALLGAPLAEFRVGGRWLLFKLITAPLLALAGLLIDVGALLIGRLHAIKLFVFGLLLIFGGIMVAVRVYRRRGLHVLVYPEGFVQFQGGHSQAYLWEEIARVQRHRAGGHWSRIWSGSRLVKVQRNDGHEIILDDALPQLDKLMDLIETQSLPHLLPRALEQFHSGETIHFGNLKIDLYGVIYRKESLRWQDLGSIKIGDGQVTITKKGKWLAWQMIPSDGLPNGHLLKPLMDVVLQRRSLISKHGPSAV